MDHTAFTTTTTTTTTGTTIGTTTTSVNLVIYTVPRHLVVTCYQYQTISPSDWALHQDVDVDFEVDSDTIHCPPHTTQQRQSTPYQQQQQSTVQRCGDSDIIIHTST